MSNDLKELIAYGKSLKVLFVEDNKEVREQLLKLLQNFFSHIDIASDGITALKQYQEFNDTHDFYYDIIITDLSMPKMDGFEFAKEVMQKNPHQVIVVISAHTESSKLLKLIEIGIYKFLRKPVDYREFISYFSSIISKIKREKNYLNIETKVEKLEEENESLNKQIEKDKLTSIYNRKFLDDLLKQRVKKLKDISNTEEKFVVILIDLDNFNLVNDTYGKDIGDKILIEFATILKNSIRTTDTVGRWGGEEFMLILERTTMNDASKVANKLKKIIEESSFNTVGKITASLGITSFEEKDSISSLIQRADYSLYKAKEKGKNSIYIS